jgi:hypothetical protein
MYFPKKIPKNIFANFSSNLSGWASFRHIWLNIQDKSLVCRICKYLSMHIGYRHSCRPKKKGSSRFAGKRILDFQEEVGCVAKSVGHALDDLDAVVDAFQDR